MLKDIRFEENGGKYGKQRGVFMPGGFWVPQGDVELAWKNASTRYPRIDWDGKVCSATFFDPDEWKGYPFGKQLALGRCIKFFSIHGMLGIEVANPRKKGKRFYRRKL